MGPARDDPVRRPERPSRTVTPDARHPRRSTGWFLYPAACSVAGRMCVSRSATQTGRSIVNPSNQQNLPGLKPRNGRTSIYGVIPLS